MTKDEIKALEEKIVNVYRNTYDPEIPVNIFELGLIYETEVTEDGKVKILMTLTTPNCPVAESLPEEIKKEVSYLTGVTDVELELTFDPPWDQDMMSEVAKLELGLL